MNKITGPISFVKIPLDVAGYSTRKFDRGRYFGRVAGTNLYQWTQDEGTESGFIRASSVGDARRQLGLPTSEKSRKVRRPADALGDPVRTVIFSPYVKGKGPTFTLRMWDARGSHGMYEGKWKIAYLLTENGPKIKEVLFEGSDFRCPHAIDSDECVKGLMGFLTLRPGDTDEDYFRSYTPRQMSFAEQHAEALSLAVLDRFGE